MQGVLSVWQNCHLRLWAKQNRSRWSNKYWWILSPSGPLWRFHSGGLLATCLFILKSECIMSVGNCLNDRELRKTAMNNKNSRHPDSNLRSLYSSQSEADWPNGYNEYGTHSKWGWTCVCVHTHVHTHTHTPVQADKAAQLRMNPERWQSSVSTVMWHFERMKNDEKECTTQGLDAAKPLSRTSLIFNGITRNHRENVA